MATKEFQENAVVYRLFPNTQEDVNSNLSITERLEVVAEDYVKEISDFLQRYVWHNDSFNLHVTETGALAYLEGSTCFEENVEDEWFIVWLLFHLTEKHENLVIQVEDEDGEFLLVEAAEFLPKWVNPDSSENRVFIYQGSLHIIPMAKTPADVSPLPSGKPSLSDAVSIIRNFSSLTKAADSVQEAIQKRIKGYPEKMNTLMHRAHCYVPCAVAAILKEDPHLISPAVKAFYTRTPTDLKACKAMKYFPPETCVMTEVLFTRCLYAQLSFQKYVPDKRTGWKLPSPNDPKMKACELGIKLACGFEILAASDEMSTDSEHDFSSDVRWRRFLKSLVNKGYFNGEVEGTVRYQRLLHQAKEFYLSSLRRETVHNQPPGVNVKRLLRTLNFSYDELKRDEENLKQPDDDSWMDITPEKLDSLLESMSQQPLEMAQTITGGLKTFLHRESGIDGVEAPVTNQKNKKQKVNFDADAFAESFHKILDFKIPESDDDSSASMSSYSNDEDDDDVYMNKDCFGKAEAENFKTDEKMKSYMDEMDQELAKTNVGLSFEKLPHPTKTAPRADSDIDSEDDDFQPVDVDLNALKNILESYSSQQGIPGPVSSLYASIGMQLPDNEAS